MKFLKEFYCDYFIFNSSSMPGSIKTFILWLTLTVAFQANAQQKIEDSSQLNQWIKEGLNMESVNSDSALLIYKKVIRQAEKINYQPALAKGYHYAGIMYAVNGNMDSAMLYYNNAVSLYRRLNDLSSLGRTYMNIANIYQYKGEYKEAIPIYFRSVNFLEAAKDTSRLSAAYANLGNIFQDLNQFDKASHYFLLSIDFANAIKDSLRLGNAVINMGAMESTRGNYDTALVYFKRALNIASHLKNNEMTRDALADVGDTYIKQGKSDLGKDYLKKALVYAREINYPYDIAQILITLGKNAVEKNSADEAMKYLSEAVTIADSLHLNKLLAGAYEQLSKLKYDQHNYQEAYNYYTLFKKYNDTVFNEDMARQIDETESKYQVHKKQDSILLLQKSTQLQNLELHKRRNLNIALIAGCTALLLLIVLSFINFKRKNQLLKQSEELKTQRIREMEKQQQIMAMQSVIQGQEEERGRLARDLHDGVGGLLSGVKLSMSNMKGNVFLSAENAQSFNNVISQLDQSIAELRRVSHNMMPEALVRYGLKEALENYCENLNISGKIKVQLQTYGMEKRMDQNTEIVIYRIIQELLNNIIKHAEADNVLIQLVREAHHFNLTVEDDGKGFDVNDLENKSGAGLANIRARAAYLNGSMDIVSKEGEGTSVNIEGNC